MSRLSRPSTLTQWILAFCVPFASLVVLSNQVYLRNRYGLSAWKGGGMGMFASTDELSNRYAKVFLIQPDGGRNPLVQLSSEDSDVLNRALEYPTRKNFLRAARQIAQRNWIPAYQQRPVLDVNSNGDPVGANAKSYRVMVHSELRPEGEQQKAKMEIQFWKISYDPHTRHVGTHLADTFLFSPQELFGPEAEQNKS